MRGMCVRVCVYEGCVCEGCVCEECVCYVCMCVARRRGEHLLNS